MSQKFQLPEHVEVIRSGPDTAVMFNRETGKAAGFRCLGDDRNEILDVAVMYSTDSRNQIFLLGSPTVDNVHGPADTFRLCLAATQDDPALQAQLL